MQELIVNNKPAVVEVNFDQLRESLSKDLEKYRVVVTADTVKDAKALATELNQTKKLIDTRRKDEVAKASEPVKQFDSQMKELVKMIDSGRAEILDQVKRFEDETRAKVTEKLEALRAELWSDFAVEPEFQRAEFQDLVILSSLTQKGNLTARARDDLKARILADKGLQDRTRLRLSELENESYRHGLAAPLTRDHVEHFLFADEEKYRSELSRILDAEVDRQVQAEQRERDRLERHRVAEERAERERQEREEREEAARITRQRQTEENDREAREEAAEFARQAQARKAQEQTEDMRTEGEDALEEMYERSEVSQAEGRAAGYASARPSERSRPADDARKVHITVECLFDIDVPAQVTDEQIEDQLRAQMADAGFQSKPRIRVIRT